MPYGYSNRTLAVVGGLLVVVAGGALVSIVFRRSDANACPRTYPSTDVTALLLWDQAGGLVGSVPEVMAENPNDLHALADPEDSDVCRRLRALLPDTLKAGPLAPNSVAFYRAGDVFIVPVVPNPTRSEIAAMERGEFTAGRSGTTYVYDAELTLLATYPN
jgi:hypothetical protein